MTCFKAQAMARTLQQRIIAVSGATAVDSQDANGMPIVEFTDGGESLYMKVEVEPDPANPVDSLGLPQVIYSPHQITILQVPPAEAADFAFRAQVLAECAKQGCKLLLYEVNPLPSSYNLSGATLVSQDPSDPWNPLTQSE